MEIIKEIGPITGEVIKNLFKQNPNPETIYRKCLGIIRLPKEYEKERVEKASKNLLDAGIGRNPYLSLKKILERNLEEEHQVEEVNSIEHSNIRGKEYFA